MKFTFKDCAATYSDKVLTIANSCFERVISLEKGIPSSVSFTDRKNRRVWAANGNAPIVMFGISGFDFADSRVTVNESTDDNDGLSDCALSVCVSFEKPSQLVKAVFRIYPDCPFLSTVLSLCGVFGGSEKRFAPDYEGLVTVPDGTIEAFGISDVHLKAETISLSDVTDVNNELVAKQREMIYAFPALAWKKTGQFFTIESTLDSSAFMVVKEAPSIGGRLENIEDIAINAGKSVLVRGLGLDLSERKYIDGDTPLYNCTVGFGKKEDLARDYRAFYRHEWADCKRVGTYTLSNTWGDRNCDEAICGDFVLREAADAKATGVDVVQIDDGWQKGLTMNSKKSRGNGAWGSGYYAEDENFWTPDPAKFKDGFEKSAGEIKKSGEIGLWFSPDFDDDYTKWQRDAYTITHLHDRYGVRFFKIDGVNITNKTMETNLLRMIREVRLRTGADVVFNFDITAQRRWGYLFNKQYGSLFLENRYTDFGNYYPYSTLRNIWMLSEYIPAQKLQTELLNLRRNTAKYGKDDPLAPCRYTADYAFAAAFFSCPLFWMELSGLCAEDKRTLSDVTSVFRSIKKNIACCDVSPIGSAPDGVSFTGFTALDKNGNGYILLFREVTKDSSHIFEKCIPDGKSIEYVYSNFCARAEANGNNAEFFAPSQRTFLLARVK